MTAPDAAEMTLQSLLERVERASGPDRKLDGDLYNAFCSHATQEFTEWDARHDFTHSLDTALTLVAEKLPGWIVTMTAGNDRAEVVLHEFDPPCRRVPEEQPLVVVGATLPLALLAAMLRALIQENGRG